MNSYAFLGILLVGIILVIEIPNSFGHGLGSETMDPVTVGDKQVTLEVGSATDYDTEIRQITIDLSETSTRELIKETTISVELIKGDEVLLVNNFECDDGMLIMNLVPSEDEDVQVINQETFASFFGLAADQFNVKGKVFESGGLYEFNIKILTIDSYSNVLTEPIEYYLGISIPETTYYEIYDVGFGKQEVGIITYYDQISDFEYDQTSIKFIFPFDWSNNAIEQSSVVHQEVLIPKTFGDFLVSDFSVYLNEIPLSETVINIDDFSKDERIIHIVISQTELMDLFENEKITGDKIVLEIKPNSDVLMGLTENSQFKIMLDWEPRKIKPGQDIMLEFDILDIFLKNRPISVSYDLSVIHDGIVIFRENGVSTGSKDVQNQVGFLVSDNISGPVIVKFENLNGNELANLELPIMIDGEKGITIQEAEPETIISLSTDEESYQVGDTIYVTGNVGNYVDGDWVTAEFIAPNGKIAKVEQITPNSDGDFSTAFKISLKTNGIYKIKALFGSVETSTSILVGSIERALVPLASVNEKMEIAMDFANKSNNSQPFAFIVQIKDENNTTISLSNITGVLGVGQTLDQVLSYIPTEPGTYTIEKFLWSDLSNPTALIDEKETFTFIASDFGITISEP